MFLRKWLYLAILSFVACLASAEEEGMFDDLGRSLKNQYDKLPPKGKFATGAVVGFSTSRLTVNTAVSALKIGGAAFIASEVLNYAGALEYVPDLSDEQMEAFQKVRNKVVKTVNGFRVDVRKRLQPETIRSNIEGMATKEQMATLGFAAGAFVGFMI